ncbi:MAG: multiprotein bridging factor aMBF1 [Candidatus Marsarchaeota archaeon]|nr:multiprotein bridging factor aMBF1 [Candidatus Marsarchaeota archaeon]
MEECELCGSPVSAPYTVLVEGVELRVCAKCAKGKKVMNRPASARSAFASSRGSAPKQQKVREEDLDVVENYGGIIKKARESMGIPIKVLGEMINEKETLLLRIEEQKTLPSIGLARKLERALNIKLLAQPDVAEGAQAQRGQGSLSIGDFVG